MTMTVRALSVFFGKAPATIRSAAQKLGYTAENGKAQEFDRAQVEAISRTLWARVPQAVKASIALAFQKEQGQPLQNQKHDSDRLDRLENLVEQLIGTMAKMLPAITRQALPEPITQDHYTIAAFCRIKNLQIGMSTARTLGLEARKRAQKAGIEIRKVHDERYGFVGSYPREILDSVFTEWQTA
jgi:hypothetical protein